MEDTYIFISIISIYVLLYTLVSAEIKKKINLPESLISMVFGILIGPYCLNFFTLDCLHSKQWMFNFSKIILCLQTMGVAMSLPKFYIIRKWHSLTYLVVVVGLVKCFASFLFIRYVTGYGNFKSWSIASSLTPTDPILSSSIIQGDFATQKVPIHIRRLLSAESGINDGLGIILLFIGIDLYNLGPTEGIRNFIVYSIFMKIIISFIFGVFLGLTTKALIKYCYFKRLVTQDCFITHTFLLIIVSIGLMELIGGSELICIFFCGIMFSSDDFFELQTSNRHVQEVVDNLLATSFFVFFGASLELKTFTFFNLLISSLIIVVRRPFICLMLYRYIPDLRNRCEGLFVGWFGPIGVGAVYYALLVDRNEGLRTLDFVNCTVFMSVVVHGLSVPIYLMVTKDH